MRGPLLLCLVSFAAVAQPIILEGELPSTGGDFVLIPFDVPAGTAEIEVRHPVQQPDNILDYGLRDPERFRGWGGGNKEPIVIAANAASRSYLTGSLPAGKWKVIVGKAKVVTSPAKYRLEIDLRTTQTLPAQPERKPYVAVAALKTTARWYAGDFHVHSRESGDAAPTLDEISAFARGRGLDFVEISDHNTVAQLDFLNDAQARSTDVLFIPGVEFTTYAGHANGIGATKYVDHLFGIDGQSFDLAAKAFADQGAVLAINHPMLDLGLQCIGCAWKQKVPKEQLGAVEIGTGGWNVTGLLFTREAISYWANLVKAGLHVAPIGGSDDHSAGKGMDALDSPIGSPTTMVFATELSAAGILEGVKQGRTVVKLQGPMDPMVELTAGAARLGDTLKADSATLEAKVTGGKGHQLKLFHNGTLAKTVEVDADDFKATESMTAPATGSDWWRAEVWVDGQPRTVTGHLWQAKGDPVVPMKTGCSATAISPLLLALLLWARRRSKRDRQLGLRQQHRPPRAVDAN